MVCSRLRTSRAYHHDCLDLEREQRRAEPRYSGGDGVRFCFGNPRFRLSMLHVVVPCQLPPSESSGYTTLFELSCMETGPYFLARYIPKVVLVRYNPPDDFDAIHYGCRLGVGQEIPTDLLIPPNTNTPLFPRRMAYAHCPRTGPTPPLGFGGRRPEHRHPGPCHAQSS